MQTPEILYEDDQILVCHKPAGVPVQTKKIGTQDMESILKNYLFIHSSHHAGNRLIQSVDHGKIRWLMSGMM